MFERRLLIVCVCFVVASTLLGCSSDETTPHPVPVDAGMDAKKAAVSDGAAKEAAVDAGPEAAPESG
jgi:hypothetical protein